jgi:N-acetylmuramoyl-L-alanine amidase
VTVISGPICSAYCGSKHKTQSHLSYTVKYLNEHRIKEGGRDFILSLHMNAADNHDATGVEVYYSQASPKGGSRWHQAVRVGIAISTALGLRNRGVFRSDDSQHSKLAILDSTIPPALLLELGFITNENDLRMVEQCGADAVIAAILALLKR